MQFSVQTQWVELGKEVPMQVSKGTQLRLMEGPRRVLVLRPLQTFGNIIDGCHIEEAGQAEGGEGLLLSRYLHLIVGRYEKVVDTISPYSATSIVQAQSMIKCCRPIPSFCKSGCQGQRRETHHAQGIVAEGDQVGPGGGLAYTRDSQR